MLSSEEGIKTISHVVYEDVSTGLQLHQRLFLDGCVDQGLTCKNSPFCIQLHGLWGCKCVIVTI